MVLPPVRHQWSAALEVRYLGALEYCTEHGLPAPPPTASRACPRCGGLRVDENLSSPPPRSESASARFSTRTRDASPWWLQVLRLFVTHPENPA